MINQQLCRTKLEKAEPKEELAGTDILVLSAEMLRETGLFPGEMRELRIPGEQPGQGIVCTLGFLEKGGLSEGPPCVGKELGSLLLKRLRSLAPTEDAILAAPLAESLLPPLPLEGILVQRPPGFRQEHDEALLRFLEAWLRKKRGINIDMEYRWQANAWCLAQGNGQRDWGSVDLTETKVFFVSDWPKARTAWVQYIAARRRSNNAQRLAQQAYTAWNRLAEELLRRREGIATNLLRRAGILVCLARTAQLLQTEFIALNLIKLSADANSLWHVCQGNKNINEFWALPQYLSFSVSRKIPIIPAKTCSEASAKIKDHLQQPLPPPPALTPESSRNSLEARIFELEETCRQYTDLAHNAEEKNTNLKTIKEALDAQEERIKMAIAGKNGLIGLIEKDMKMVAECLTSAAETAPQDAPWHVFLSRLAVECEQTGRTWISISDNTLGTWWQTLYGQDEPDHVLAEETQDHYAASGLTLLQKISSLKERFNKSHAALILAPQTF